MTICPKCNKHLGDINIPISTGHICVNPIQYSKDSVGISRMAVKCDICGSTAIDHTEAQCNVNRQLYKKDL